MYYGYIFQLKYLCYPDSFLYILQIKSDIA